jgi:hypothetical protein
VCAPLYGNARELHLFNRAANHPATEASLIHDLYGRAVRAGFNNITDSTATEMTDWQAPGYHAEAHLYDSGNTPKLTAPPVLRTHIGQMNLNICVNPTMGVAHPPDVMRNEYLIILPKPNNAETVKISVASMPSGNVLVDEISDP